MDYVNDVADYTMGAPLIELVGKSISQDEADALSVTVACTMNVTPGRMSSITSFSTSESGAYNFAAMTSDFAIALQVSHTHAHTRSSYAY